MLITGETSIYCIIGYPILHSLSPIIHNIGFADNGLNSVYVPFALKPEELDAGMKGLKALGVRGMSVTVPLKELVFPYMDETDEYARMTGAVNTVLYEDGKARGFNSDVVGVKYSLELLGCSPGGGRAVVLGAGGAARAVVAAFVSHGFREIVILNRSEERAGALRDFFTPKAPAAVFVAGPLDEATAGRYLSGAEVLVNTTSVGMYPKVDACPVPAGCIPPGIKVLDAIYRPRETKLLAAARGKGCRTLCGLDWLVHQGIVAFNLWTGKGLDREKAKAVLERHFA